MNQNSFYKWEACESQVKTRSLSTFLEEKVSGRLYSRPHYQEFLLEILLFILEGVLHEDCNGFPLTGCVHLQQLLERVCGETQLLGHLLTVVVSCLLHSCWVLTLGQNCHRVLQTKNWSTVDGIHVGLHQSPQPWMTQYILKRNRTFSLVLWTLDQYT